MKNHSLHASQWSERCNEMLDETMRRQKIQIFTLKTTNTIQSVAIEKTKDFLFFLFWFFFCLFCFSFSSNFLSGFVGSFEKAVSSAQKQQWNSTWWIYFFFLSFKFYLMFCGSFHISDHFLCFSSIISFLVFYFYLFV